MRPWLLQRAAASPGELALLHANGATTWSELADASLRFAASLRQRGVQPGDVVALDASGARFAAALHALDLCGAIALPLNARLAPREIAFQLGDAGAALLLHEDGPAAERAAQVSDVETALLDALPPAAAGLELAPQADPEAPYALVYTSGTTGAPRGVTLARRSLAASARASALHFGVHPRERWLLCMPLFHVGGLSVLVRSALSGFPVVVQERFDPEAVSRALDEQQVTLVSLVPTMLGRLLDARAPGAPSSLRCVLLGGAGAPDALLARAAAYGIPVTPSYGLTEAASQVATCPLEEARAPLGAGLEPLPGTEVRVDRETGEILVRGATLMRGYWKRPEETAKAIRDGWLHTGDYGALDERGRLRVNGRLSERIVSGGENVDPAEVEAALAEHPEVREAAVAAVPDPEFGERPAAWIVTRGARAPRHDELQRFCRARLAGYKVPVAFEVVEDLPRNASGKLLRRQLRPASHLRRASR